MVGGEQRKPGALPAGPLPVTDLLFVGRAAARVLAQYGVSTIGDLARFDRFALGELLGKQGAPRRTGGGSR